MSDVDAISPAAGNAVPLLLVTVAGVRMALPAAEIAEVLPAARLAPLPDAPDSVLGVLDLRGDALVVVNGEACVGRSPTRSPTPLRATDRLVVVRTSQLHCAVRVDGADDLVLVHPDDLVSQPLVVSQSGSATVVVLADGVLAVQDIIRFVSTADAAAIRRALEGFEADRR